MVGSGDNISDLEFLKDYLHEFEFEIAKEKLLSLDIIVKDAKWFVEAREEAIYSKEDPTKETSDKSLN